ncbi:MAG: MFS transporter [Meiothermus sp.]|uniref:MFS transporter n=1 Tax=Meiothermus sp. TaxID=1955249 RepID=UPI0025DDAF43|nr:MFS transporter [Meiothermus sp.]MCS7058664.1 MFS transporter [Meiothermus sp.]MCS7195256.1 MFS transporter [Meiothermus sp.]MCX7741514.1 MFS transporter [Meiothermus sp.]MDW8090009.1 MFS transporter [Meiothermus sp.]
MWSALGHPGFRWLFISSFISTIGSKIHRVALLFVAYQETQNAVWVSLILGAQFVASALLGPLLGPLADRYDRRVLMVIADLARAFLVACIPLFAMDTMPLLMLIAFSMAALEALHYSASQSAIPELVPESSLDAANGLMTFVARFADVTFVALAGVLVANVGPAPAFWIDATSYLISSAFLALLPPLRGKDGRGNYFASVVTGLQILWQNPVLSRTVGTLALAAAFGSVEAALGIVYAVGALKVGVQGFGVLEALMAGGAILGLFATMPLIRRFSREAVFLAGLGAFGVFMASTGLFPHPLWAGVAMLALGFLNTMFIVPARSIIQLAAPSEVRGRVMAAFGATMQSAVLMGTFLAGVLEPRLGVLAVLFLSGMAVSLIALTVRLRGGIPRPSQQEAA